MTGDDATARADVAVQGMARVQRALRGLAVGDEAGATQALDGPPAEMRWVVATLLGIVQDVFASVAGNDVTQARLLLAGLADNMDDDMAQTGAAVMMRDALRGPDPS